MKRSPELVKFTKQEKDVIVKRVRQYFTDELQQEIGQFDAEFLLDFFANEFGAYFYNRGLLDAKALLAKKVDDITDAIHELEKPTDFRR
ncbi:MAG: DUF2164 domain-containing protein [Bacteroidota bacterium]